MKVAITVWNNRVSPVFDVARSLLVLEIENGQVVSEITSLLDAGGANDPPSVLSRLGIDTLICGAISKPLAEMINAAGIHLIPFTAGDIQDIITAFLSDDLPCPSFLMPGCRHPKAKRNGRNETDFRAGFAPARKRRGKCEQPSKGRKGGKSGKGRKQAEGKDHNQRI